MRITGKRYRHLLYEDEDIEETSKKAIKKPCIEKVKAKQVKNKLKNKKKAVTKMKKKENLTVKESKSKEVESSNLNCPIDSSKEVFAEHFQFEGSEKMKVDILSYNDNPEDDPALSIRGVKYVPEIPIEMINVEGFKLPLSLASSTPMADNAFADFPALSPINLSSFGTFGAYLNFPKTPKGVSNRSEISKDTCEMA